jgi:hypothetical protein
LGYMTPVTIERLRGAANDDELFLLLGTELERRLPDGRRADDRFVSQLRALPRGLRAMAATYELDVSLALDDLGWHFGNWHHLGLSEETLDGLQELDAASMAEIFGEALGIAREYWDRLGSEDWSHWYNGSPLEQRLRPLNDKAWKIWHETDRGLFAHWIAYARQFPERLI